MSENRHWVQEFGEEVEVPAIIDQLVETGFFEDSSYRSDICPSFRRTLSESKVAVLWVDYPLPEQRECQDETRYHAYIVANDDDWCDGEALYEGDDLNAVLTIIKGL